MNKKIILIKMVLALVVSSCVGKNDNISNTTDNLVDSVGVDSITTAMDYNENSSTNVEVEQEPVVYTELKTGDTPYREYYGGNPKCKTGRCSEIKITAGNSDVLVLIKQNEKVVRHAFVSSDDSYTFSLPNGTYQPFFYYGSGWNKEKVMKNGEIKGGFMNDEDFGKDDPQYLKNNRLEYELFLQKNGNFRTTPSDPEEAL